MASSVIHFEIYVDDIARAKKFYSDVFGWAFQAMGSEFNDYNVVYTDGEIKDGPPSFGTNGGMLLRSAPAPENDKASPNAFVCIVSVDDVDGILKTIESAGGRIDMPAMDVPTVGRLAYIRDTEMNLVGVMKPTPREGN